MQTIIKQFLKSFFTLNKSEQKGIMVLLFLIMAVILFNLLMPLFISKSETDFSDFKNEISLFRAKRNFYNDSISLSKKQSKGKLTKEEAVRILKPFKFNPNSLSEEGWLEMGFTAKQFQVINNYRKKGGYFKTSKDVKKMYCISDVEFEIIEAYIKIDKPTKAIINKRSDRNKSIKKTEYEKNVKPKYEKIFEYSITELNSADSAILVTNLGIKPWLALRIIKYRNMLGGYYDKSQLLEVYGFSEKYYQRIDNFIEIDSLQIKRINVNNVTFKQLLKHPYIDYETTKLIFNSKPKQGITYYLNYYDFKQKTGISDSISTKIRHYLYFGPPK